MKSGRGADAIRFLGFDPVVGVSSAIANDLGKYGFRRPTPLLTERGITLVIADTSGLQYSVHGDRVKVRRGRRTATLLHVALSGALAVR